MLIRHVIAYLFARGLPGIVNFLALAVYTRLLTSEDFGRYSLVIAGVGLVHVVVFQWLLLVCGRFLPTHIDQPQTVLRPVLAIFLFLSVIFALAAYVVASVWAAPEWHSIIPVAIVLTITQAWHELNLRLATARLDPGRYGVLSAIKAVLALLLGAVLAWMYRSANAPLAGLIFGAVVAWLFVGRNAWTGICPQLPAGGQLKEFGSYGFPLAITFSLVWITSSSDRLMIAWFLGEAQTGIYAVGYDMAQQSLGLLLTIVNTAATPLAIKVLEKEGVEAASRQMRQNGELMFALAFSGAAGLMAIEPVMIGLFVGEEFREGASTIFLWIALTAAVIGIKSFHFDIAFHLTRKSKWLLITSGLAAIANLGLNLVFVPYFGIVGAAWSALLAYSVAAVSSAVIGFKVFPMPRILPLLRCGIVPAVGIYWSAWFCMQTDISPVLKMMLSIAVAGGVAVMIFLILNIAEVRQLASRHGYRLFENIFKR
ncbi:Membrane protein involved in the export of O-antigen and teichoic acid [Nitrosomonas eutropha]|uniref:Membrane protein involved in the export of O-antigen and teichoic acid n=1 Tax=Nitrosomonas eutropha TaxID=916 RepID=A0A1I7HAX2_9PROT|nr:oligosaccharide flippase family protein [Nitrosomonas eutropha]SFU57870.1 Membrane protein involved in the export of O-antigen and teichoic acid [Nitrosomonas eutropha]